MKKGILYTAIAVAVVALIMWKLNSNKKHNEEKTAIVKESSSGAVPVLTENVSLTTFDQSFAANGNFQAVNQIDFSSESSGRITQLMVKEGTIVKAGQALAKIDNQVVSADLEIAQANVDAARTDMERYQRALQTGGVTQKQVDDMTLQYHNAQAKLTQARKNTSNALLKSPIDGIINAKYVEVGAYLSPGTKLFQIVNISRLKLVVSVPEGQVVSLHLGQEVPVVTSVYPEVTYKGKITFIAAKGDETLNYPVEVEITNISGKELKAGMYGTATFSLPKQDPLVLIPRGAFYAGISNNSIFVLQNGKAVSKQVTSGRVFGDKVEVRNGLNEGETVIISGQVNLTNGTPVSVQKQ